MDFSVADRCSLHHASLIGLSILLALSSCSRRTTGDDDDEQSCGCHGDLPEGGRLDLACEARTCLDGVGYHCVEEGRAVVDPEACGTEDDADAGEDPGEPDAGVDAAAPVDVCHSGYADCDDGILCCGDLVCDYGTCRMPEGDCTPRGSDCSSYDCCAPFVCLDYEVGWRCALPDSCADVGDACADDGGCCGGLECAGGTCRARATEPGDVPYGEYCWDGEGCPSLFYACEAELCCIPADWSTDTCRSDGECCTGACLGGICDCAPLGDPCRSYSDCCGADYGPICLDGQCCMEVDASCDRDADCCTGQCDGGFCACLPEGAPSSSSGLCCNLVAINGRCG